MHFVTAASPVLTCFYLEPFRSGLDDSVSLHDLGVGGFCVLRLQTSSAEFASSSDNTLHSRGQVLSSMLQQSSLQMSSSFGRVSHPYMLTC